MLGERGGWYKQYFYEWSARVPMIVNYPERFKPARVKECASLVDILPTCVDLAAGGADWEEINPLDGNSLVDVLDGDLSKWDDKVISEYTGEGTCAPCRMIRRGQYKLIYTHGFPDLMYDLENDPNELENIVDNADVADIYAKLKAELMEDYDPEEINAKCLQSQKDRRFIQDITGGNPNWAFKLRSDDDRRYVRNAGAIQTKAKARYPFFAPPPIKHDKNGS